MLGLTLPLAIRQYVTQSPISRQVPKSHGIHVNSIGKIRKYGQLYRRTSILLLLHVLSTNKTDLEYAMVNVPSASVLAPISSDTAHITWLRVS
jgi:hypothetical protein